jgi:hypothetical protein
MKNVQNQIISANTQFHIYKISAVLREAKLTPAKSGRIPTQLLYLSVSCYLSINVGICFL